MKLRHLFSVLSASLLLMVGCQQEPIGSLENLEISTTYMIFPKDGGDATIKLKASEDWAFVESEVWPRVLAYKKDASGKVIKDENGNKVVDDENSPLSWLTLKSGDMKGTSGEYTLVFSAGAAIDGRELEIEIVSGNFSQYIRARQGDMTVSEATVAEINAGPTGKTYKVTGTCTEIAKKDYGNWYLVDEAGDKLYVYGTLDAEGKKKNFESLGIEPGDIVTVEGPKDVYNGTVELVDVTVLEIKKSLIKIVEEPAAEELVKEGGEFSVKLAYKGDGVMPSVPEAYRSWVSVVDVARIAGEATKQEPNPADTAIVKIALQANQAGARDGQIVFSSATDKASSSVTYSFSQEGSIAEVTVADFLAAEVGTSLYKLTGKVTKLKTGNYGNFHLEDATGSVYVYGLTATQVEKNDQSFPTLGIKEGDIVTLIGTRAQYANATNPAEKEQVGGPAYYVSHVGSTEITVADFKAKSKDATKWYRLTGTIKEIVKAEYGNFYLEDETGYVYVYGLTKAPVAKNDKSFESLGLQVGDQVTIVGTRDESAGSKVEDQKIQVGGPAYYISHKAAGEEEEVTPPAGGDGATYTSNVTFGTVSSAYTDGKATVNGVKDVATLKFGTSNNFGEGTVKVPAGTKKLTYYAVAWKGAAAELEFSVGGNVVGTQKIAANDGATGSSPYTITVTPSDQYTLNLTGIDKETVITVKTVNSGKRAIMFGVNAE